jgi:murein DD-endopeptidase MepM/ murein hydrolase activator NlpD
MIKRILIALLLVITTGFLVPEPRTIPVLDASSRDWNINSFWFEPWGSSGTHKGIDIFGDKGKPILASSHLWILYTGELSKGGKVVLGLGSKWRLHYFAHLDSISTSAGSIVSAGTHIGTLGDTGNAKGKPPHLHFSLVSLIPYPWRMDQETQGYKKAFFLDPNQYFQSR